MSGIDRQNRKENITEANLTETKDKQIHRTGIKKGINKPMTN